MKVIIPGGAGFIGSHLAERLLRDDHEVVVLDNLSTGRRENLASCANHPALTLHEVDIADGEAPDVIEDCVDAVAVGCVEHLKMRRPMRPVEEARLPG